MTAPLQSVLHPAGPDARLIADMAWLLFCGGALIFLVVMALLALALRRAGRQLQARHWIIGGGLLFPLVVLSALLGYSLWRSAQLSTPSSQRSLVVEVRGHMWWWEVRYRDPAGRADIVLANEIHIPVGTPVHLALSTRDVIHSLWMPALNGKMDMVPGRATGLTLHASKAGVYRGQCAEFCGEQHARMALHVVAEPAPDYAAWLARQRKPAAAPQEAIAIRGRDAFIAQRCNACHTVRGVAEGGALGPDLTHVGSRLSIGAGTLATHRGTLAGWLADPQASKPGARMPGAGELDGESLRALATWLEQLK
jgi:cytochrome c oxidase subunit II